LKVLHVSDTHCQEPWIPEGWCADLVVHTGDATLRGRPHEARIFVRTLKRLVRQVGARRALWIPGNHDTYEAEALAELRTIEGWRAPEGRVFRVGGLRWWASSASCWCPETPDLRDRVESWHGWARSAERRGIFAKIPPGLDALITHTPPAGILDRTLEGVEAGDPELFRALYLLGSEAPRAHLFGHIHEQGLQQRIAARLPYTLSSNGATVDRSTRPHEGPGANLLDL
jgi:hypothetical protein